MTKFLTLPAVCNSLITVITALQDPLLILMRSWLSLKLIFGLNLYTTSLSSVYSPSVVNTLKQIFRLCGCFI
ncbi:unnamed protein product [Trifolium pratense]|uniref:Uncharacterized protein n=1 Tax=Trifolium pratense TaxID=57577 RepID=A0ACB0JH52_TRIPR|nr:unnamed protein product [Trifolium pratense]